jgi:hypothetical protein
MGAPCRLAYPDLASGYANGLTRASGEDNS